MTSLSKQCQGIDWSTCFDFRRIFLVSFIWETPSGTYEFLVRLPILEWKGLLELQKWKVQCYEKRGRRESKKEAKELSEWQFSGARRFKRHCSNDLCQDLDYWRPSLKPLTFIDNQRPLTRTAHSFTPIFLFSWAILHRPAYPLPSLIHNYGSLTSCCMGLMGH